MTAHSLQAIMIGLTSLLGIICGAMFVNLGRTVLGEKFQHIFTGVGTVFIIMSGVVLVDLMGDMGWIASQRYADIGVSFLLFLGFLTLIFLVKKSRGVLRKEDMEIE